MSTPTHQTPNGHHSGWTLAIVVALIGAVGAIGAAFVQKSGDDDNTANPGGQPSARHQRRPARMAVKAVVPGKSPSQRDRRTHRRHPLAPRIRVNRPSRSMPSAAAQASSTRSPARMTATPNARPTATDSPLELYAAPKGAWSPRIHRKVRKSGALRPGSRSPHPPDCVDSSPSHTET